MADIKQFKVAAVQMAPVQNNTAATIDKVVAYMEEAAREGAKIVAFPEAIVPGYPWWILARRSHAGHGPLLPAL